VSGAINIGQLSFSVNVES